MYLQAYMRRMLKSKVIENSELHFSSEAIIKVLLMKQVQMSVRVQLQLALENILYIDNNRGLNGTLAYF